MSNTDKLAGCLEDMIKSNDNGVEFGYIQTPDADDPYWKTIKEARRALASYRASKDVADDELVQSLVGMKVGFMTLEDNVTEPSKKEFWKSCIDLTDQAIARLQAAPNPWVKIEDIPEEWKDGRPLHVMYEYLAAPFIPIYDCNFSSDGGIFHPRSSSFLVMENLKYVMLPIAPPL